MKRKRNASITFSDDSYEPDIGWDSWTLLLIAAGLWYLSASEAEAATKRTLQAAQEHQAYIAQLNAGSMLPQG